MISCKDKRPFSGLPKTADDFCKKPFPR
jgi:hypothetical protein